MIPGNNSHTDPRKNLWWIFLRKPKETFLEKFLDKFLENPQTEIPNWSLEDDLKNLHNKPLKDFPKKKTILEDGHISNLITIHAMNPEKVIFKSF